MTYSAMILDATLLIVISLSILFLIAENDFFQPILYRMIGGGAAWFSFSQAMWLMGVWVPGASGFPLPRIGFDAMVCALMVALVIQTVKSKARHAHG